MLLKNTMPRTIEEGFRDFLTNLTPSTTESQAAKSHRASIEACLRNNFGLHRFVRIGSFGNGTSISGFSDVDYLACLPTSTLTRVHYVILTSGHLRSSIVVGWKETMVDHPTCGGAPDGHGSRNLL
jgi:tRNA nucleotidyltransferase (CCA-adding enzyme)